MYYQSQRNPLKNWLKNTNLKPYFFILGALLVIICIILVMSRQQISDYFNVQSEFVPDNTGIMENTLPQDAATEPVTDAVTKPPDVLAYHIKVNKADNMVSVWNTVNGTIDSIKVLFHASINAKLDNGRYFIDEKNIWRTLNGATCVQYSSKSASAVLFHSPVYEFQNRGYMIVSSYEAIGSANEHIPGITLTVADAKWIYENCSESTEIEICDDSSLTYGIEAEPLREIPDGIRWDPTDPDRENKWVTTRIQYVREIQDKTVVVGTAVDPWHGTYATDVNGANITSNLTIRSNVNTNVPGTYTIEYILADFTGQVIRRFTTVTVIEEATEEVTEAAGQNTEENTLEGEG